MHGFMGMKIYTAKGKELERFTNHNCNIKLWNLRLKLDFGYNKSLDLTVKPL